MNSLSGGSVASKKTGVARWNLEEVFRLAEMFGVSSAYMVGEEPLESAMGVNAKTVEASSTVFTSGPSLVAGAGYAPATSRLRVVTECPLYNVRDSHGLCLIEKWMLINHGDTHQFASIVGKMWAPTRGDHLL